MKSVACLAAVAAMLASMATAAAAERTVRLSVPGMTCASCPYIVEQTLSTVGGVTSVKAELADRSARVTFDDRLTSLEAILAAVAGVGYPSSLIQAGDDK